MPVARKPGRWGAARVAVTALRDEIAHDLAAKLPVSDIYRKHQSRLGDLTQGAFARQVRLLVKAVPALQPPQPNQEPISGRERDNPDRSAFDFNPNPQGQQWKRASKT